MALSPPLFDVLFHAWKQAETVALIAEKHWINSLDSHGVDSPETLQCRLDLLDARKTARNLLGKIFEAASCENS